MKKRTHPLTVDDVAILAALQREAAEHICGRCRTPFGRSSIPCPNDRSE